MIGQEVSVVLGDPFAGPPCCIQTAEGHLLRGNRVPDDYASPFQNVLVHRGRCVRFRGVDGKNGIVVFDGNGVQQKYPSTNGWSLATFEVAAVWEVREVEPPPIRGRIPRGQYLPHRDTLTRPVAA